MKLCLSFLGFVALVLGSKEPIDQLLKKSNGQFTAKFTNEVISASPNKSVVLSAFSVLPLLGQIAIGAVGDSQREVLDALSLPDEETTKNVFRHVNKTLKELKAAEFKVANRIYIADDVKLNPKFAESSRNDFNSDAVSIDFKDYEAAAKSINTWVEDQTNERIKNLIDDKDFQFRQPRMVLVNAVYFKGQWMTGFPTENTKNKDFHITKSTTMKIPTMLNIGYYNYGQSAELGAKILELAYENEEASMTIVLPNEIDGLDSVLSKLKDYTALSKARESLKDTHVYVTFPKFRIETELQLEDLLQNMGIKKIFNMEAKLDNMIVNERNLTVGSGKQKAFISINEKGTEAAAASYVPIMSGSSGIFSEPEEFTADRPFSFYIIAKDEILFSGVFRGV